MEVIDISPSDYKELKFLEFNPKMNFRYKGIHALYSRKNHTVFDTWNYERRGSFSILNIK